MPNFFARKLLKGAVISLLAFATTPAQAQRVVEDTTVVILFVDLTTSVENDSIRKVAEDMYKIFINLPLHTKLTIYPIDATPFVQPITEFTFPGKGGTTSQKARNLLIKKNEAVRVVRALVDLHQKPVRDSQRPRSCIIRSLDVAHTHFSQFRQPPGGPYRFELIYLSDMIEECTDSPLGSISLTRSHYQAALRRIEAYDPAFDLSYANVSMIISVNEGGERYISYEQLKHFWALVFGKSGFSDAQISGFHFLPTLPLRLSTMGSASQ